MARVGEQLRHLRLSKELSLRAVAEKCHITPSTLSRVETGHGDLKLSEFIRVCDVLGVLSGDLLENSGNIPEPLRGIVEMCDKLPVSEQGAFVAAIYSLFQWRIEAINSAHGVTTDWLNVSLLSGVDQLRSTLEMIRSLLSQPKPETPIS